MKRFILLTGLMTILCTTAYAENGDNSIQAKNANTQAPVTTNIQAPVTTNIQAPVTTNTQAPVTTNTQAPVTTNTQAPVTKNIQAPVAARTQAPITANTQAPVTTSTQAPVTANTQVPVTASSSAPTTSAATSDKPATSTTAAPATSDKLTTPSTATPATSNKPATTTPAPAAMLTTPPKSLDCNYRIPAETTRIAQPIVLKWAAKAAEQSFNYDYNALDKQLADLKACYTDQGWQGFKEALQKSGNLDAIKSQQLIVNATVTGEGKIVEIKENQWKVTLPMQVTYQNNQEKLTQSLTVNLVVGRKISGDLGIMQMIAIPRQPTTTTTPSNRPPPANTTTPSSKQP
jgi:Type-IV b secretion system, inner-membrane complex component